MFWFALCILYQPNRPYIHWMLTISTMRIEWNARNWPMPPQNKGENSDSRNKHYSTGKRKYEKNVQLESLAINRTSTGPVLVVRNVVCRYIWGRNTNFISNLEWSCSCRYYSRAKWGKRIGTAKRCAGQSNFWIYMNLQQLLRRVYVVMFWPR